MSTGALDSVTIHRMQVGHTHGYEDMLFSVARSIQPAASSRFLAPPRNLERIDLSLSATLVHPQVKYLYWTRQSAKNDASYQPALVQKGGPRIPLTLALHGCL